MRKLLTLLIIICFPLFVVAQVTFILESIPDYTPPDDQIYIAGTMTGWNPGLSNFVLEKNEDELWSITLGEQPEGTTIDYKFTRGDWLTVEKDANGNEMDNRVFTYGNGDTVSINILNWADNNPGGGSTAAENVSIMDESFYMPQLDRNRRIWIYLPPDYDETDVSYPVLYMHDAQNLFDVVTSFAGEWEVDETLNNLASQDYQVPIVVGIDNGSEYRLDEYTPWAHPTYGGGEGDSYIRFIHETLKPYIDNNYRTLAEREYTGLMGSSLGGLISHYGGLAYQEVFSKAGVFSPSYWFSDSVWSFTSEAGYQDDMKVYLMCGSMESSGTVQNMLRMEDTLLTYGFTEESVISKVVPGGQHNEALWRNEFAEAYLWLFGSYASDIFEPGYGRISIYPNPVKKYFKIAEDIRPGIDSLIVLDMMGRQVLHSENFSGGRINVKDLNPGLYVLLVYSNGKILQGKFVKI